MKGLTLMAAIEERYVEMGATFKMEDAPLPHRSRPDQICPPRVAAGKARSYFPMECSMLMTTG